MVMARGFRILVLSRKSFTGTGLRATGVPEPATERRTAAAVTDPSWQRHPGHQAHRGNQRPGRRDACHLGPWRGRRAGASDGIRGGGARRVWSRRRKWSWRWTGCRRRSQPTPRTG